MQKLFTLLLAFISSTAIAITNKGITYDISNGSAGLSVKDPSAKHNGWFHTDPGGLPGVLVDGVSKKVTSFQSLTRITKNVQWLSRFGGVDNNGVVVLKMNNMPKWVPGFHNQLGNFAFKKVGEQELYFGEWLGRDKNIDRDRVVYYAGNNKTTALPSGKAVYTVTGINKNQELNQELLKGEFTADFANNNLTGSIAKSGLTIALDKVEIKADDASFSGTVKANNSVLGDTKGQFFGNNAAALAGFATFNGNNQYDTAFGGTKK